MWIEHLITVLSLLAAAATSRVANRLAIKNDALQESLDDAADVCEKQKKEIESLKAEIGLRQPLRIYREEVAR